MVSAGGTREPLDPVRYLGNRSSGKQGFALARVAAERGAEVTLVAANPSLTPPDGVSVVAVQTALELREAVLKHSADADVVVMAAAVADFRPADYAPAKIKKTHPDPDRDPEPERAGGPARQPADQAEEIAGPTIRLVRNPDVLAELVQARGGGTAPVIVGFAAETGDAAGSVLDHARAKLDRKGCDLLVANEVGQDVTFGKDSSTVHILRRGERGAPAVVTDVGPAPKVTIAATVWDVIQELLPGR